MGSNSMYNTIIKGDLIIIIKHLKNIIENTTGGVITDMAIKTMHSTVPTGKPTYCSL